MVDQLPMPVFESPEQALLFSYRHKQGEYPANQMGKWQTREALSMEPRLPSGLDAATLAGWVRNAVEGGHGGSGLVEPYRSVLVARYSVHPSLNVPAKINLVEAALAEGMGTGLHRNRMVDLLVQRFFGGSSSGKPIRQHQVADLCNVSQKTVSNAYFRLSNWMRAKEVTALELVMVELKKRELVA